MAELGDPTVAAIASAETAELYGLQILSPGINAEGDNTTRFIVIERADTAPTMTGDPRITMKANDTPWMVAQNAVPAVTDYTSVWVLDV